jgi:hypothetical protein
MHITVNSLKQPDVRYVNEREYRLEQDYNFCLRIDGDLKLFTITKGFKFDGASVPRLGMLIGIERDGYYRPATLIHDWLYENNGCVFLDGEPFCYVRKDADQIFRECLKHLSIKSWKAWVMYHAVRIGGRFYRNF